MNDVTLARELDARAGHVTGLECSRYAETWQTSVYGMGGMYEPHHDFSAVRARYHIPATLLPSKWMLELVYSSLLLIVQHIFH